MDDARLQAIEDRLTIADLLHRYTDGIDRRDFEAVADCFTADAHLDYRSSGGPAGARDEVVGWLAEALAAVGLTRHHVTNQRVTLDGDRAHSEALFLHPMQLGGTTLLVGGRYVDDLVRTADGWRIERRVQHLDWMLGGDPATLTGR